MMHFQKNYSIGFIRHAVASGTTTSLIVGVDLGKLFEDKQSVKKTLTGLLD
jgi:hypothetical protein